MPLLHSSSRLPAPLSAPVCPSEPEKQIAEEEVTARRPCIINIQSVVPFPELFVFVSPTVLAPWNDMSFLSSRGWRGLTGICS